MPNEQKNQIDVLLAESLKEIARSKPIEKITIKEITDKAGVIRPTFYNHFQDKYELVEWIVNHEILQPVNELLDERNFEDALMDIFSSIEEEKEFYMKAVAIEGQNSFGIILRTSIKELILHHIDREALEAKLPYEWLTVESLADFYCEPISYLLIDWIKTGMKIPKEEIVKGIIFVSKHSPLDVVPLNE
jgi:probable dihydroxyacetone kinase regulator